MHVDLLLNTAAALKSIEPTEPMSKIFLDLPDTIPMTIRPLPSLSLQLHQSAYSMHHSPVASPVASPSSHHYLSPVHSPVGYSPQTMTPVRDHPRQQEPRYLPSIGHHHHHIAAGSSSSFLAPLHGSAASSPVHKTFASPVHSTASSPAHHHRPTVLSSPVHWSHAASHHPVSSPAHWSHSTASSPAHHRSAASSPVHWSHHQENHQTFHDTGMLPSIKDESSSMMGASRSHHTSIINASAIQRRLAIERRNLRRNIVPRSQALAAAATDKAVLGATTDVKNTKNRESAAAYREKRDRKMKFILAEVLEIQAAHPTIHFRDWTPAKLPKSERKPNESKEDYRRRTNRESAAGSREQQKEKLQYLTDELLRMRALVPTVDAGLSSTSSSSPPVS
ncbi:Aste57867_18150 [Aphanomyces stellatus]|uniref:Aste57867_18150 protein n=1 Tax=Aphanomyces stellatus TaxID=120398 RepID=A0A485LB16_9STRA|nr:hypothetical protein As57867_018088 [Aphanomyces stellatus]VFT94888.1 Aste57867_18150 [Aphanomyces stellatus]